MTSLFSDFQKHEYITVKALQIDEDMKTLQCLRFLSIIHDVMTWWWWWWWWIVFVEWLTIGWKAFTRHFQLGPLSEILTITNLLQFYNSMIWAIIKILFIYSGIFVVLYPWILTCHLTVLFVPIAFSWCFTDTVGWQMKIFTPQMTTLPSKWTLLLYCFCL